MWRKGGGRIAVTGDEPDDEINCNFSFEHFIQSQEGHCSFLSNLDRNENIMLK